MKFRTGASDTQSMKLRRLQPLPVLMALTHLPMLVFSIGIFTMTAVIFARLPVEVAHYMAAREDGSAPQSNDVDVGDNGLIYLLDRNRGLEILEMTL